MFAYINAKKNVWNIRKFITQMFDVVRAYILRATQKCFFNLVNKFARRDVENFRHPKFERAKIRWHYVTTIFNITSITTRKRHCDEKKSISRHWIFITFKTRSVRMNVWHGEFSRSPKRRISVCSRHDWRLKMSLYFGL